MTAIAKSIPNPDFLFSVTPTNSNNPDVQTADTINLMRVIVRRSVREPELIRITRMATAGTNLASEPDTVIAIFSWIKNNIRFQEDFLTANQYMGMANRNPNGEDFLISPLALTTHVKAGDCDDFSMLAATMLEIVGIPARFVTIAADNSHPSMFSHVYCQALVNHCWIGFDASHGKTVGWEYPNPSRYQIWSL